MILFYFPKELPDAEVQFLQNWLQPQTNVMRRHQRPQEDGQNCGETSGQILTAQDGWGVSPTPKETNWFVTG